MRIAVATIGNIEKDFSFLINFAIGEFFSSQKFKLNTKKLSSSSLARLLYLSRTNFLTAKSMSLAFNFTKYNPDGSVEVLSSNV